MKYLIIDDEHELYKQMYAELLRTDLYDVEEIRRMRKPQKWKLLYKIHFSPKLNAHFYIPFKFIWNSYYDLNHYNFKDGEQYTVLFLNGSVKVHYNKYFFKKLKKRNPNVKLVLIMYDSVKHARSVQTLKMFDVFDTVFSFDEEDCYRYGFKRLYSIFSIPDFVEEDKTLKSAAFFIGRGDDRTNLLKKIFKKVTAAIDGCRFYITDVDEEDIEEIKDVIFNQRMAYCDELRMAYNTDCIIEIVRDGQNGISLRTCEAVAFRKKLITNNKSIAKMPFYNPQFMKIISDENDIDLDFIRSLVNVDYGERNYFSPLLILKQLEELNGR